MAAGLLVEHVRCGLSVELEGVRILLPDGSADELLAGDCEAGREPLPADDCAGNPSRARADCVLISAAHSALVPGVLELCACAAGQVLATEPMIALLRAQLFELEHAAHFDRACAHSRFAAATTDAPCSPQRPRARVGLACIEAVRDRLASVVYGQRVRIGPLILTAASAGGILGAAHWSVRTSTGFVLGLVAPSCEPARSAQGARPYALRPDPFALRTAHALVLPRCALASRRAPSLPRPPQRPAAFAAMLGAVCSALRAPEMGLEAVVVLSLAHGALAEVLDALGRALDLPREHGLRAEASALHLVVVAPSAPPLLAFHAAAPEWHSAERQRHAMGPNYLYPFGAWQRAGRLVLAPDWIGAAPYAREGAGLQPRAIFVCSTQAWADSPARPAEYMRWLPVPLDAAAARAVELRASRAGRSSAGVGGGDEATAGCGAGTLPAVGAAWLASERLLHWEGAAAMLAASGAKPAHIIVPLELGWCRGEGSGAGEVGGRGESGERSSGRGGGGASAELADLADALRAELCAKPSAPARNGELPAMLLLEPGGAVRVPTTDGLSFSARLSEGAARALVARRTSDGKHAFADTQLLLVEGGGKGGKRRGLTLELPAAMALDGAAYSAAGAGLDGAAGAEGARLFWGAPDPRRVLGSLEQLGFDAECVAVSHAGAAVCAGHKGGACGLEAVGAHEAVEVRLLGQHAGAKLVISDRMSEIVVDGRAGIDASAALVARRALRQIVLGELLASGP